MGKEINPSAGALESEVTDAGLSRRGALECMVWAGTGLLLDTVGRGAEILGPNRRCDCRRGFSVSRSCRSATAMSASINQPIPTRSARCCEAIGKVKELVVKTRPAFMIHTGDITHLSKPDEFDNANQIIGEAKLLQRSLRSRRARRHRRGLGQGLSRPLRQRHQGAGLVELRRPGGALRRSRQCGRPQGRRPGALGGRRARLARRTLKEESESTPIVVFAHIPLWTVYRRWGWGTEDG